jgi:hypothetical protein
MAVPLRVTQGWIDHSREFSATRFFVAKSTGDDLAASISDAGAMKTGMAVVSLCNFSNQSASMIFDSDTPTIPSSDYAQREVALWVQYVDDTTQKYETMQIPGPDLTLLAQANTDEVDIVANVTAAAFLLVIENNCVSEAGNAVTVTRMRIIGRRI